ncbi:MAG: VacJ family lipoprotein [Planctomycetes bacterium]|nr:VacJ family lipoprotein [Planctomycetota bacterium]
MTMFRTLRRAWPLGRLLLLLLLLPAGCTLTETERRDWSGYTGPGAEYFKMPELADVQGLEDPGEPTNRFFRTVNHGIVIGFIDPIAQGYRVVVPEPVRDALSRFGHNLAYTKRLIANLLQGNLGGAGRESLRFLVNLTVGVLGLFDPATSWFGIDESDEDFAQTFAKWGWDGSDFLVVPYLDMGSDRDTPAALLDMLFNPASYVPGLGLVFRFNEASGELERYKLLYRTHYDPYAFLRYLYELNHTSQFMEFEYSPEASSQAETLKAVFLTYRDEDFPSECDDDEVYLPATGSWFKYTYRMQDAPAPVMFILPGLGGHRQSQASLGLAEMAYRNGFSAVTISSAMNFEFMESASTAAVPGYGPVDAHDVHVALTAISGKLDKEYPGRVTGRALLGLSLGAYHTLLIAAATREPGNNLVEFDHYVPINPPISLVRSVHALDDCFHAYLDWSDQEREVKLNQTIMKVLKLADGNLQPTAEIPLSETEARFIIGLSYRVDLMFCIHSSQSRHNMGVLLTSLSGPSRGPAYDEIFDYSYMEYIHAFVLPYYMNERKLVKSAEDMAARTDLRYVERQLRANDRIWLFTNENDFLLSREDIDWLKSVVPPERAVFFPTGGHLGNLYKPDVQDQIMQSLKDLKAPR